MENQEKNVNKIKGIGDNNFRNLFKGIADAIFIADPNSKKLIDCNKKAEKLTGYSRKEILSMKASQLHPEDLVKRTMEDFKKHADGKLRLIETEIITKDKKRIPVSINSSVIDLDGKPCLFGVFRDITERKETEEKIKKSEEKLKKSEQKYKELYRGAPIGLYEVDFVKRKFVEVNDTMCEYMGYSREEMLGMGPFDFLTKQSKLKFLKRLALMKLGKKVPHEVDFDIKNKKGEILSTRIYTQDVIKDGKIVGAKVVAQNISEQKKARSALQDSEEQNKLIAENTSDLIAITEFSLKANFLYVNLAYTKLLGYDRSKLIGKSGMDFIHPDDQGKLRPLLLKYLKEKTLKAFSKRAAEISEKIEYRIKDGQGNWHLLASTVNVVGNKLLFVSRDVTEEKKAEEKLKNSKKRYQAIFNNFPFIVFSLDRKGRLLDANAYAEKFAAKSKEKLIGKSFSEFGVLAKGAALKGLNEFRKNLQGRITEKSIYNITTGNGKEKIIELIGIPIKDDSGKVESVLDVGSDITDELKTKSALKESEEKMRHIIEHSNELFYIHDINHKLTYVSPQSLAVLGYTPEEMMIKWTTLITDNPLNKKGIEITETAIKTGEKQKIYNLELRRKDGSKIFVEIDEAPLRDENNKVIGMTGAIRDVSERIKEERKTIKEKEKIKTYLNLVGAIVVAIGRDQRVTLINKIGCKILGYKEKEIISKNWFNNFIFSEQKQEVKAVFDKIIAGEEKLLEYYENKIITKTGEKRLIAWHNVTLKDENGKIIGTLSSGEDITERKQGEKEINKRNLELEKANKLMVGRELKMMELKKRIKELGG